MREIDISTGAVPNAIVLVDDEDFEWVARVRWTPQTNASGVVYAVSHGRERFYLHRQVMRARFYEQIDHADRNGLNNTKANLRVCTNTENLWNAKTRGGTSKYRGVFRHKNGRWMANIKIDGKHLHLGRFDDEEAAARAFDAAAIKHRGEFARINFPELA